MEMKEKKEMEMKEKKEEEMMTKNHVQERFSDFYEKWLFQQESYLKQLLIAQRDHHNNHKDHQHHPTLLYDIDSSSEESYRDLIANLMNHYKEYYSTKWAGAHEDIVCFFCPPWLTPLENAYLWMTDWKPSMLYRLIRSLLYQPQVHPNTIIGGSLISLTDDQLNRIEELRLRTDLEEMRVDREMERQHWSMADQKMVELAQLSSHHQVRNVGEINNVIGDHQVDDELVEVAMKSLLDEFEKLVKTADCVRLRALKGVMEVFTPLQSVDFMATFLMLKFQLRRSGMRRQRAITANEPLSSSSSS